MKILIIEDDTRVSSLLSTALQKEGHECTLASDGESGVRLYQQYHPDLVVLDKGLPKMNGLSVCSFIRQDKVSPKDPFILMLTGAGAEMDRVVGLHAGADDYMVKPFSLGELTARVYALLRREHRSLVVAEPEEKTVFTQHFVIDPERREVLFQQSPNQPNMQWISLTAFEFDLLFTMAKRPGRVWTRNQLIDATRGETYVGDEQMIDGAIRRLRKKIDRQFIQTVIGVGYKFEDTPCEVPRKLQYC